jgi:hypothetical protein
MLSSNPIFEPANLSDFHAAALTLAGYRAFHPDPLPPELTWTPKHRTRRLDSAISEKRGICRFAINAAPRAGRFPPQTARGDARVLESTKSIILSQVCQAAWTSI